MKILVIGSGGREHALVWKLAQSKKVSQIFAIPGNGGMYEIAECYPEIEYEKNFDPLIQFVKEKQIDLTIVGPEDPLSNGIVDAFEKQGLKIFGPNQKASQMEASKGFAKEIMQQAKIPTGAFSLFTDLNQALQYIEKINYPMVIKADGLAKGKGVFIIKNKEEAIETLKQIMEKKVFGASGDKVIIEEFLQGDEITVLGFTDGETIQIMPFSRDHKKLLDNDQGPNTGGMGAFAPVKYAEKDIKFIRDKILYPAIQTLKRNNIIYKGVLYAGLIKTKDGFKVLEFNARLGDPEAQVILPLLKTDLVDVVEAILHQRLKQLKIKWDNKKVVTVVAVSQGYPDHYEKGIDIRRIKNVKDVIVFHAGTKINNNVLLTNGGRVLNVTAITNEFVKSRDKVYKALKQIRFKGIFYRKDIGKKR